ncbi:DUF7544 domain-containing protein [Halocalculus aciditolerans]|uniref:Uncharacterized protein n=1 Tax=Halocalculus aciditolerans TaxID=1383812 RepID=A0A830F777_9EURY|nr:hypothetical protein [Halocalculus aciditolerans]GGL47701.1 hypothetical protein GCM10009039_02440 [Halocalculus aciditolerans]
MSLYATEDVTDAFHATKAFLTDLDLPQWFRLAVIALLTGGVSAPSSSFQFNGGTPTNPSSPTGTPGDFPTFGFAQSDLVAFAVALLALAVLIGLLLWIAGSILQFAFVDALATGRVAIRRNLREHWWKGFQLFLFSLAVAFVVIGAFLLALAPLLAGVFGVLFVILLLPVAAVVGILAAVVDGFTRAFVVPIMLREDRNVLSAWSRLWGVLRANFKEYGAFVLLNLALTIGAGIVTGIGAILVAIVVAIPIGIVFGLPFVLAGASGTLAWAWLAIGLLVGGLAFLLGIGLVNVPVQSYLRYYALFLLGDTDADLDLIPDRRAAARDSEEPSEAGGSETAEE